MHLLFAEAFTIPYAPLNQIRTPLPYSNGKTANYVITVSDLHIRISHTVPRAYDTTRVINCPSLENEWLRRRSLTSRRVPCACAGRSTGARVWPTRTNNTLAITTKVQVTWLHLYSLELLHCTRTIPDFRNDFDKQLIFNSTGGYERSRAETRPYRRVVGGGMSASWGHCATPACLECPLHLWGSAPTSAQARATPTPNTLELGTFRDFRSRMRTYGFIFHFRYHSL